MLKAFVIGLLAIITLVAASHVMLPALAGVIAVGGGLWVTLLLSIIGFCAIVMGVFIASATGILIMGGFALVWLIIAILLFPILFPLLIPLFILYLFISYMNRRTRRRLEVQPPKE